VIESRNPSWTDSLRSKAIACVVLLLAPTVANWAIACLAGTPAHQIDPTKVGIDVMAPSPPDVAVVSIVRGRGPRSNGDGTLTGLSTDDLGMAQIRVTGMSDNDTAPTAMGLRIVVADSLTELGRHIQPRGDVRPTYSKADDSWQFWLSWVDGGTDIQEPVALRILFRAVDAAGNVSAIADTLDLKDPGRP
jgi:hypothetical protein